MRLNRLGWFVGLASILAVGCTVKEAADDENDGAGGNAGTAGTGGTAGTAGTGGGEPGPCGDVPTSGECVNDTTIRTCLQPDGLDSDEEARVIEAACPPGRVCRLGTNGAECTVVGECVPGDIECSADGSKVRTCEGSGEDTHWVDSACDTDNGFKCLPGTPSSPADCYFVPSSSGGSTHTFSGRMQYEYRPIGDDNKSWGAVKTAHIIDMYMTIYDNGEYVGAAMSGYDSVTSSFTGDGSWVAILTRELQGPTEVWAWPIVFNYTTGLPAMSVAKLKNTDVINNAREANEYWAWGIEVPPGTNDIGTWVIKENEYSGALHIFSWIDYGLLRAQQYAPDAKQMSLAVYWDPNVGTPSCGACFCGTACGGAQLQYGDTPAETDYYDSWIALGGPPSDGQTEWARAVISHEFGHYVMANYSLSPGEGGPHYVNAASKPGLAYSEAWATSFGCSSIGSPMYVDEQNGSFFWVDISKYTYSGGALEMPDPNGPIDQFINENIGAGMIWKLWANSSQDSDGQGLGDAGIMGALMEPKLVNGTYNRGYDTVDLIDYFDAAICSGSMSEAEVNAVTATTGFPYDPATRPCQ